MLTSLLLSLIDENDKTCWDDETFTDIESRKCESNILWTRKCESNKERLSQKVAKWPKGSRATYWTRLWHWGASTHALALLASQLKKSGQIISKTVKLASRWQSNWVSKVIQDCFGFASFYFCSIDFQKLVPLSD